AITLPCSDEMRRASSAAFASSRRLNSNITRARRCGLTRCHSNCAAAALRTATSSSSAVAIDARACTSPVLGSKMSLKRPDVPATRRPPMKCSTVLMNLYSCNARSGALDDPLVRRIVREQPLALRTGHDIQVVQLVAVRRSDRMVATRHEHDVAILHRQGFIQRAIVGIDALESEALRRIQAMVVSLLERSFLPGHRRVVLVRRIARPVTGRRDHLDDEKTFGGLRVRKDVAHEARVAAFAAHLVAHLRGFDQPCSAATFRRCGAYRELD